MDEVFISYASQDRDKAAVIATSLESKGWSVWWDREVPPGRSYDQVIEEALAGARAVFVLWSKASVESRWVRAEASAAAERRILVPVFLEPITPPLEFRHIQAVDLSACDGEYDADALQPLSDAVAHMMNMARSDPQPVLPRSTDRAWRPRQLASVVIISFLAGAGAMYLARPGAGRPPTADSNASAGLTTSGAPLPAGQRPSGSTSTGTRPAQNERLDILSSTNGGHLVQAPHENWNQPIDGSEGCQYLTGNEALYAFKDNRTAIVDTFRMLITEARDWNVKQFELFTGSDTPSGPFRSVGVFETQNLRLFPSPWQDFGFTPAPARYFKVRVLNLWSPSGTPQVEQWQLMGTLR